MLRTWRRWMETSNGLTGYALALLIGLATVMPSIATATSKEPPKASHKQSRAIRVSDDGTLVQLHTFAMSPDRELWLSCQTAHSLGDESDVPYSSKVIQVRSPEGLLLRTINLPFAAQAINFSSDGIPFIAGEGKIARLSRTGEVEKVIDAPNLLSEEEMKVKIAESNKKMLDQVMEGQDSQLERLKEQVAKLEEDLKKDEVQKSERVKARTETRLTILKQQLEGQQVMYDTLKKSYESMFGGEADTSRYKLATGVAVTKQDVFVSLPSLEGHGYAIYRLTHDLTEAKLVVDEMHGCCGQLDIQSDGTHLIVAANSSFKVRYFNRDGEEQHSFGERGNARSAGATPSLAGWGSCCNPMNVRCDANNELLVAESSIGHIKRYSHDGEFLGLVGTAKIAGGCKHVAIAHDNQTDWYYMMNTSANNVLVLVPNDQAPAETEDERESRMAMEGLGQKLLGSWRAEIKLAEAAQPAVETRTVTITVAVDEQTGEVTEESEVEDVAEPAEAEVEEATDAASFDYGNYILQQNQFLKFDADGKLSRQEPKKVAEAAPAESAGGFLGAVATIFLGSSSSEVSMNIEESSSWVPIRQQGDLLQIGLVEDEVLNYVAAVRFIDADHAEFKWYYGEVAGEPMGKCIYKRVAQAESCEPGACKGDQCDVPGCEHDSKTQGEEAAVTENATESLEGAK